MTWARAALAAQCLAAAGPEIGGLWLRARSGPARDAFLAALPAHRRIHPDMSDDAIFGGLDLTETLRTGRPVHRDGVLKMASLIVLTGAERCSPSLAARLGQHLDAGGAPIVAVDEGEGDAFAPASLTERLGLFVTLDGIPLADLTPVSVVAPRASRPTQVDPDAIAAVTSSAVSLGIDSLRAPRFALAAARSLARLEGRSLTTDTDMRNAVALTMSHRAASVQEEAPPPEPPAEAPQTEADQTSTGSGTLEDRLVDAARVALPPGLLTALAAAGVPGATGSGAGAEKTNGTRGRPRPARPGSPSRGRIDTVATLRAAAPWQSIRRTNRPNDARPVLIEPADIRLRRFRQPSQRLVIFILDASGSAAMARLAEAKGAIERLLSDAYAARDHVAVIGFRGTGATCLLPPTGSLTRAKRALAGLPGGGGTPLANGLELALFLARQTQRGTRSPSLVLLTDGRANIDLEGMPDRAKALSDSQEMCRRIAAGRVPFLAVDTGARPNRELQALVALGDARYLALPRAGPGALAQAVSA